MNALSEDHKSLVLEVLRRRSADRGDLRNAVESGELSSPQRSELCQILGSEFAERGLDGESEPTGYGLRLEEALDAINRPNLGR
jgi:hypothetical protein